MKENINMLNNCWKIFKKYGGIFNSIRGMMQEVRMRIMGMGIAITIMIKKNNIIKMLK
jgi:hypothetical protein